MAGVVTGAAGLLFVQERYLPQRLSAESSARISNDFVSADAERSRLADEVGRLSRQQAALQAERDTLKIELQEGRTAARQLQADLRSVVDSLPADPRKGVVEVRAARFASNAGMLDYHLVLTRERPGNGPLVGSVQLVVTGGTPQRADASFSQQPIALTMDRHQIVRGSLPLPEGFRPRQTTVKVLDRSAGKLLGMRVLDLR